MRPTGGLSNGPSCTFAILVGSLPQIARGKIKLFLPLLVTVATKATIADPHTVLGKEEEDTLVANGLRKVGIVLLFAPLDWRCCFANLKAHNIVLSSTIGMPGHQPRPESC
jgi:hypothetical protein